MNDKNNIHLKLQDLICQIPYIQSKFKWHIPSEGVIGFEYEYIYDNPEFIEWLENVIFVLKKIYELTNENYIGDLLKDDGIIKSFSSPRRDNRESFVKLVSALKIIDENLCTSLKNKDNIITKENKMKKPKLFISHASKDIKYVQPIVELLADIGLSNDTMFCSSVPDYGIPMDNDIYDCLKSLFNDYELHVVFILSSNYYKSPACLNEMGAAWVLQKRYSTILLPNFEFSEIKGAVNPNKIALKLDTFNVDELKSRLGELKKIISVEFKLSIPDNRWEKKRNDFIQNITSLIEEGD